MSSASTGRCLACRPPRCARPAISGRRSVSPATAASSSIAAVRSAGLCRPSGDPRSMIVQRLPSAEVELLSFQHDGKPSIQMKTNQKRSIDVTVTSTAPACPVCGRTNHNILKMDFGRPEVVNCPACGQFRIARTAIDDLNLPFREPKRRALASHLVRKMQGQRTPPL